MSLIQSIHHVAIICSDYRKSKNFYTDILGFTVASEHFRPERESWKCDLHLDGHYVIELFSFPEPPPRVSRPEAAGLRHLAFGVRNLEEAVSELTSKCVSIEAISVD